MTNSTMIYKDISYVFRTFIPQTICATFLASGDSAFKSVVKPDINGDTLFIGLPKWAAFGTGYSIW